MSEPAGRVKPTFYGAALDASLPGFRFAAGPFYDARYAAMAAWMCIEQADRDDVPVAPFRQAKQGDHFLLNVIDEAGRSSVIGPYEPGDLGEVKHRQAALADSLGPLLIGTLRYVYTLPSGMQAAVIEALP